MKKITLNYEMSERALMKEMFSKEEREMFFKALLLLKRNAQEKLQAHEHPPQSYTARFRKEFEIASDLQLLFLS